MDRHTVCEYPIDSTTGATSQWHESATVSVPDPFDPFTTLPYKPAPPDSASVHGELGTALDSNEQAVADDEMNLEWEVALNDGSTTDFWNASAWNLTPMEMEALSTSSTIQNPSTFDILLPEAVPKEAAGLRLGGFDDLIGTRIDHQPDSADSTDANEKPPSPIAASDLGLEPAFQTLSAKSHWKRNRTGKNPKTRAFSVAERHVPQTSKPSASDPPSRPSSNPSGSTVSSSLHVLVTPEASGRASLGASNASSEVDSPQCSSLSSRSTVSEASHNSRLFGVSEIMKVICDYPKQMLRPNFWSPFVHHRHYRCSKGGLAEPIAIALCCVSANLQSVESSLPFLCKTINAEKERLVTEFPTKSENLEDAMAALHAMCIYQIETILVFRAQKSAKQHISSGELYHHFLLKMTRRLCQEHIERISLKDNMTIDWHTWTMAETLRRTTFLVNMINELSYHANALNPAYYESLHPSLVQDLPLPAPEIMWRALNEREWAAARDSSGWTGVGVWSLSDLMTRLESEYSSADGSSLSQGGRHNNIQKISNLILSSARHVRQQ